MPGTSGPIKRANKRAAAAVNKRKQTPTTKRHGQAVMKDDPKKAGRKIGYGNTKKTVLPPKRKTKPTTKAGRQSLKKVRGR